MPLKNPLRMCCRWCRKTYSSTGAYSNHVQQAHLIQFYSLYTTATETTVEPVCELLDSDWEALLEDLLEFDHEEDLWNLDQEEDSLDSDQEALSEDLLDFD